MRDTDWPVLRMWSFFDPAFPVGYAPDRTRSLSLLWCRTPTPPTPSTHCASILVPPPHARKVGSSAPCNTIDDDVRILLVRCLPLCEALLDKFDPISRKLLVSRAIESI